MNHWRKSIATILVALGGLLSPFLTGVAHADTLTNSYAYGCNDPDGNEHYQVIEYQWQRPNGTLYKTWYMNIYSYGAGGTFQLQYQNAMHMWTEWHIFLPYVTHQFNDCAFQFSAFPGFGWQYAVWAEYSWIDNQGGVHRSLNSYWNGDVNNPGLVGDMNDRHPTTEPRNSAGGYSSAFWMGM